jgi:tetratricopeptide (TPR) repeat protein
MDSMSGIVTIGKIKQNVPLHKQEISASWKVLLMMTPNSKVRTRFVARLLACLCIVSQRTDAAAELEVLDPPQRYIVVVERARTMSGDESNGSVLRGTVLEAIRANGRWRYMPQCRGWVHLRDLVPLQEAVTRFSDEIQKDPAAATYQLRGIAYMAQEQWAKAAQDFEKSYDLGDSSIAMHLNLGACYEHLGQADAALREYDSILNEFPDEFPTRMARGNLLVRKHQYAPALRDFEEAIRLQPEAPTVQNMRGIALRMLGRYQEAVDAFTAEIANNPESAEAFANRGYARKCLAAYSAAKDDYEKAITLDLQSNSIRNDFAWLLACCPDASIRDPQRSVALSEECCRQTLHKNGEYVDTLAAAYAIAGNFPAAIEAAKLALTMLGDHPAVPQIRARLELYERQQPYVEPAHVKNVNDEGAAAP